MSSKPSTISDIGKKTERLQGRSNINPKDLLEIYLELQGFYDDQEKTNPKIRAFIEEQFHEVTYSC
jgi:hypothetical protein